MHFNKPGALRKQGPKTPWTVHYRGTCYQVQEIDCHARMQSVYKPEKKDNPRAFFTSMVKSLELSEDGLKVTLR